MSRLINVLDTFTLPLAIWRYDYEAGVGSHLVTLVREITKTPEPPAAKRICN